MFVHRHPELAYKEGHFPFHNFLRRHAKVLEREDAIRRAKNRFWIAHRTRFMEVAFACATGAIDVTPARGELLQMPVRDVGLGMEQATGTERRVPTSNRAVCEQSRGIREIEEQQ